MLQRRQEENLRMMRLQSTSYRKSKKSTGKITEEGRMKLPVYCRGGQRLEH